ncbi:MAG: hypothetical protein AB7O26_11635 [Planctomycetaceae bacterium]
MTYNDLIVLIPSHSLEDFPTELPDDKAEGLLNAYAVLWHPRLLAAARVLPSWHRADDPPHFTRERLIIIPPTCEERVSPEWIDRARAEEGIVITGLSKRDDLIAAVIEPLDRLPPAAAEDADAGSESIEPPAPVRAIDSDLVADFLALGTCHLQVELLTRHMHHFTNLDEAHLKREAVAAADAAFDDDIDAAKTHLRNCFEILLEARERFYPVDCYLIDLCLVVPTLAGEPFRKLLSKERPFNVLATGKDLETIARENPESVEALRRVWESGTVDVVGGEYFERPSPLLPLESVLWDFSSGRRILEKTLGRLPTTWGRRRFGLSTLMPQVLSRRGYRAALHVAFDDGLYPDAEHSKIRWEGCDGTIIDAITRIPLAADGAASFLRFPARMAEAMEQDQIAAVMFARWPDMKGPWLDDIERIHSYAPVLGRFVNFEQFFRDTDDPGRLSKFQAGEYLTPFLIQAAAREERDPSSRFTDHFLRRSLFDAGSWCARLARVLSGRAVLSADESEVERQLEQSCPDVAPVESTSSPSSSTDVNDSAGEQSIDPLVARFTKDSAAELSRLVMQGAGNEPGFLIWNSLSFQRTVTVALPELEAPPAIGGVIRGVQVDDHRRDVTLDIAGSGFAWVPKSSPAAPSSAAQRGILAQRNLLRNEFLDVHINEQTGGIGEIKEHGRRPNRLSQQLAFRFPRERTFKIGQGDAADEVRSYYSAMHCRTSEITSAGPGFGEIVTTGDIVDQVENVAIAGFRQTVRLYRGRRDVELELELSIARIPEGDPWSNYFAARFAWNDSDAALTRALQHGAQNFTGERFESPYYLEIATESERTTILNCGLPFHRKTGPRMVDSILICAGETRRKFRFRIAVDASYPMLAAIDALSPPIVVPTAGGPPRAGNAGWLFNLDAPNVQITRILEMLPDPSLMETPGDDTNSEGIPSSRGFALRLVETEGRYRSAILRCFKTPSRARQRDANGLTIAELKVIDDGVHVELSGYEIADIELRFDE